MYNKAYNSNMISEASFIDKNIYKYKILSWNFVLKTVYIGHLS